MNPNEMPIPCRCGGEEEEHEIVSRPYIAGVVWVMHGVCHCDAACTCTKYEPYDDYAAAEDDFDAATARWEESVGR